MIKHITLSIFSSLAIAGTACDNAGKTTGDSTTVTAASPAVDNTLDEASTAAGWKLLFDGKTLNGWRTFKGREGNSWTAENGTMHCQGSKTDKSDKRGDLITNDEFDNFELQLDWKLTPQGNSGILYLVSEEYDAPYLSGPEYQLIDDKNFPEKLEGWQQTGANYAMNPPLVMAAKPIGEWNTTRIIVNKGHVEHWLNGKKTADYELWTKEWEEHKATGKWKDAPGYGKAKKGHIALQDHGSEIWFKNVKIKQL